MAIVTDAVGAAIYQAASCDPMRPPRGGAVDVALAIARARPDVLGPSCLILQPHARNEADIATIGGQRVIVIRRETPAGRLNFLAGQQLARAWLDGEPWWLGLSDEERRAASHAIGAWIAAPTPAFAALMRETGLNLSELARAFAITETCAAMRVAEVGGPDSAITTPSCVYRRGRRFAGLDDAAIRALAAKRAPRSVQRVIIRDEPGRIALLARAA